MTTTPVDNSQNPSPPQMANPWLALAGKYANDPNWEQYLEAIATARQEATTMDSYQQESEEPVT